MRYTLNLVLLALVFLSGCSARPNEVSAIGIPSPTPFQPAQTASDSLYAGSAPTPLSLPTFTPPPAPTLEPTVTPSVDITPETLPGPLNPLTGLPVNDPALLNRRPMAVKVANFPRYIRPQSGLTLADQVFEYYIEAGLTRFVAVFYGNNSEWVGPVRSGRFFDENIQRMYQSYLVFKFADKRVLTYFKTTDFADFLVVPTNRACPPFRPLDSRNVEIYSNTYFNTVTWKDCVEKNNLPSDPPSFRSGMFDVNYVPPFAVAGNLIYTYYSEDAYHYWLYVPETGEYARFQETDDTRNGQAESYAPLVDRVTATTVHAANVVMLFAYHTFANPYDEDDEVYHIDLTGSGEAYVFRDGVGIVARWSRPYVNQPLSLTETATGAPIYLKPGITFYEVLGTNSYADQDAGEWHFHHATP